MAVLDGVLLLLALAAMGGTVVGCFWVLSHCVRVGKVLGKGIGEHMMRQAEEGTPYARMGMLRRIGLSPQLHAEFAEAVIHVYGAANADRKRSSPGQFERSPGGSRLKVERNHSR